MPFRAETFRIFSSLATIYEINKKPFRMILSCESLAQ